MGGKKEKKNTPAPAPGPNNVVVALVESNHLPTPLCRNVARIGEMDKLMIGRVRL